jgi:hypothetical protein
MLAMRKLGVVLLALTWLARGQDDWTHTVRIAGHGLAPDRLEAIIHSAAETNVFGIEVDNDIPGRYESFLHPEQKLKDIRAMAEKAHAAGNRAFVYVAALECITANAAEQPHSFFKDHPDWVQRNLKGEPAMFGGGSAFWIKKGDEDVWISPYAAEWRKRYMELIRQIAATGIDGIWVDIPYWMTHFEGWEKSWASFDDATVEAFRAKTGLDARKDIRIGDFTDAGFRRWVDFRIASLTEFVKEIDSNVKAVNPRCMTIPEIYPGIEEPATVVGADVYELYPQVDAIAHEYQGGADVMAASKTPLDWFHYMIGMYCFRAFAEGKATWMLSYSWDGDKKVDPKEAMKKLFLAEVMAGANSYDAHGHVMSGSNDLGTRKAVFGWIRENEARLYRPRLPLAPVGVYFSPKTRNYFGQEYVEAFQQAMLSLMHAHREFQVVTPRTLGKFAGQILVLPNVRSLGEAEVKTLNALRASGKKVLVTGDSTAYPGERLASPGQVADALAGLNYKPAVEVAAGPFMSAQIASAEGRPSVFLANFQGRRESGVRVRFRSPAGARVFVLPYLGSATPLKAEREGEWLSVVVPEIDSGAVVWCE